MIIPTTINEQGTYRSAVTLELYARAVQYSECAIYGVDKVDDRDKDNQCRDIWTLEQRNYILRYLTEAQVELENETKRLYSPTWITGSIYDTGNDRLTDIQTYQNVFYTKWNNVVALGRKVSTTLEAGAAVDYLTSPDYGIITVAVDPTATFDVNFIRVYYPNTEIEINPSSITYAAGTMTIVVPRCRVVEFDLRDNPAYGLLYTDDTNFQATVDVVYLTTVNSDSIVKSISKCTCTPGESTGCLQFLTRGVNVVEEVSPCLDTCLCGNREISAGLYYLAGEIVPTQQEIDMIIRLAHSKMPTEPCGCEIAQRLWQRDRNIPEFPSQERLDCPFGINDGAWIAWKWAQTLNKPRFGYM